MNSRSHKVGNCHDVVSGAVKKRKTAFLKSVTVGENVNDLGKTALLHTAERLFFEGGDTALFVSG